MPHAICHMPQLVVCRARSGVVEMRFETATETRRVEVEEARRGFVVPANYTRVDRTLIAMLVEVG